MTICHQTVPKQKSVSQGLRPVHKKAVREELRFPVSVKAFAAKMSSMYIWCISHDHAESFLKDCALSVLCDSHSGSRITY